HTGVSGPPARRFRAPWRAWMVTGGSPCAAVPPGSSRPGKPAPHAAISSRLFKPNLSLAMRPIRTIFEVDCPVAALWPKAAGMGHFFAAKGGPHAISPRRRHRGRNNDDIQAGVAEVVEALDVGSSVVGCGGSSTSARTT